MPDHEKPELRKHKWERIGIIASIVAVIGTLGFSVWDKIDYRQQIKINTEQIERTSYDKLYSDVSKGLLNSTKLIDAINRIIIKGDDLSGMDLSGKWLKGLELPEELNLYRVNLSRAFLHKANLSGVYLHKADLSGAYLNNADLSGANLVQANLSDAIFTEADLSGANLVEADLRGATYLTDTQLCKVLTLCNAELEDGLRKRIEDKCPEIFEIPKPEEEKTGDVQEE
jgi:hypothetical protein